MALEEFLLCFINRDENNNINVNFLGTLRNTSLKNNTGFLNIELINFFLGEGYEGT